MKASNGPSVEFELTRDDLGAFAYWDQRYGPQGRWMRWILPYLGLMAGGMTLAWVFGKPPSPSTIILPVAFAVLLATRSRRMLNWISGRAKPGERAGDFGGWTVTVTPESLHVATPSSNAQTAWASIQQLGVGEEATYLFPTTRAAVPIPHRAFRNETDKTAFFSAVLKNIKEARALAGLPEPKKYAKNASPRWRRLLLVVASILLFLGAYTLFTTPR